MKFFIGCLNKETRNDSLAAFLESNGATYAAAEVKLDHFSERSRKFAIVESEDDLVSKCDGKILDGEKILVKQI